MRSPNLFSALIQCNSENHWCFTLLIWFLEEINPWYSGSWFSKHLENFEDLWALIRNFYGEQDLTPWYSDIEIRIWCSVILMVKWSSDYLEFGNQINHKSYFMRSRSFWVWDQKRSHKSTQCLKFSASSSHFRLCCSFLPVSQICLLE